MDQTLPLPVPVGDFVDRLVATGFVLQDRRPEAPVIELRSEFVFVSLGVDRTQTGQRWFVDVGPSGCPGARNGPKAWQLYLGQPLTTESGAVLGPEDYEVPYFSLNMDAIAMACSTDPDICRRLLEASIDLARIASSPRE